MVGLSSYYFTLLGERRRRSSQEVSELAECSGGYGCSGLRPKRIAETKVKALEEIAARQQAQIAALEKQLAEAKQQVQDIAVKAIERASGAKALSHINQIAMEQAKNRPQG